jgi:hypothetical protein
MMMTCFTFDCGHGPEHESSTGGSGTSAAASVPPSDEGDDEEHAIANAKLPTHHTRRMPCIVTPSTRECHDGGFLTEQATPREPVDVDWRLRTHSHITGPIGSPWQVIPGVHVSVEPVAQQGSPASPQLVAHDVVDEIAHTSPPPQAKVLWLATQQGSPTPLQLGTHPHRPVLPTVTAPQTNPAAQLVLSQHT